MDISCFDIIIYSHIKKICNQVLIAVLRTTIFMIITHYACEVGFCLNINFKPVIACRLLLLVVYFHRKMDESNFERRDRILLRPWLENKLENGSIPGLEWFDKNRMMFKVPWKHRSKKDWSLRHSSVFLVRDLTLYMLSTD